MSNSLINITPVLIEESNIFMRNVTAKVQAAHPTNDYLRTMDGTPLRAEAAIDNLSIFGWKYIESTERGIPPLAGKTATKRNPPVRELIYDWSKRIGMSFEKDYQRRGFAYATRQKIWNEGTRQYRNKIVLDLYRTEQEEMITRIADRIGKIIVETKLT